LYQRAALSFDDLSSAYFEQIENLILGGVDLLLIETIVDSLNAKAELFAAETAMAKLNRIVPIVASVTVRENEAKLITGQSLDAFAASLPRSVIGVGMNCSYGAILMKPFLRLLSQQTHRVVVAFPSAGLPNDSGQYNESAESMAATVSEFLDEKLVNIVGGCCGTTEEFVRSCAELARTAIPRKLPPMPETMRLAGLEMVVLDSFEVVGAISVENQEFGKALGFALKYIENGIRLINVCMDCESTDQFLNQFVRHPVLGRCPVMVTSPDFDVLVAGLKSLPGKGIARWLSLEVGKEAFLERAILIRRLWAGVVVLDWNRTFAHGFAILTEQAGIAECDIIAEILLEKSELDALDRITEIKKMFPTVRILVDISHVFSSLKVEPTVHREVNSVFLHRARERGLDTLIANQDDIIDYGLARPELRTLAENAIHAHAPAPV
jgi:5-methyltetrahydrofolate--homocysteine methyltransferase